MLFIFFVVLNVSFYDIFPEITHEEKNNKFVLEIDSTDMIGFDELKCLQIIDQKNYDAFNPEAIPDVLKTLTPKENQVIVHRFGLNGSTEKTLREVACIFGVTHERIRQIEAKALRKLRHPIRNNLLKNKEGK